MVRKGLFSPFSIDANEVNDTPNNFANLLVYIQFFSQLYYIYHVSSPFGSVILSYDTISIAIHSTYF